MDSMIVGNQEDKQRARDIYDNHQAEGTEKQYGRVKQDFQSFCEKTEGLSYETFGEGSSKLH